MGSCRGHGTIVCSEADVNIKFTFLSFLQVSRPADIGGAHESQNRAPGPPPIVPLGDSWHFVGDSSGSLTLPPPNQKCCSECHWDRSHLGGASLVTGEKCLPIFAVCESALRRLVASGRTHHAAKLRLGLTNPGVERSLGILDRGSGNLATRTCVVGDEDEVPSSLLLGSVPVIFGGSPPEAPNPVGRFGEAFNPLIRVEVGQSSCGPPELAINVAAFLPELALKVAQIKPIPVLETPFSKEVIFNDDGVPRTGFLRGNAEGQVVLLDDSDHRDAVGIWATGTGGVSHPLVWCIALELRRCHRSSAPPLVLMTVESHQLNFHDLEFVHSPPSCCNFQTDVILNSRSEDRFAFVARLKPAVGPPAVANPREDQASVRHLSVTGEAQYEAQKRLIWEQHQQLLSLQHEVARLRKIAFGAASSPKMVTGNGPSSVLAQPAQSVHSDSAVQPGRILADGLPAHEVASASSEARRISETGAAGVRVVEIRTPGSLGNDETFARLSARCAGLSVASADHDDSDEESASVLAIMGRYR